MSEKVTVDGNLTKIQYQGDAVDQPSTPSDPDAWRQPGTIEVGGDGVVRTHGPETYNGSSIQSGLEGDVMSTLQNSAGHAVSDLSKVDDPSKFTVQIANTRTDLQTAISLGYVKVDRSGDFSDGTQVKEPEPREPKESPKLNPVMTPEAKAFLSMAKSVAGDSLVDATMNKLFADVSYGKSGDAAIAEFAGATGLDPERARVYLQASIDSIGESATALLDRLEPGSGEETFKWFLKNADPTAKDVRKN